MKIGVIGGGAWGTALAQVAAQNGEEVRLWAREEEVVHGINRDHCNHVFLPGIPLSDSIRATLDIGELADIDTILVVSPAQHLRSVLSAVPDYAGTLLLCAKGIEAGTTRLMSEVAAEVQPRAHIAVLSGPTFAHEVARGLPTAVTLASTEEATGHQIARRLACPTFRPYASTDVAGAEIGGAVKNVLAIACGVVDGCGLGQNARAALISRGFAEMTRFGIARGGRAETLSGLSGLGDLVLTCSSESSRNFTLGKAIGKGGRAVDLLADRRTVAEGAHTAPVLVQAARDCGVEMPIVEAVDALLREQVSVQEAVARLLSRPLRSEG